MGTKKNIKSAALVKASSVYSRQFKQHYVTVQCLVTDGRTDGRTGGGCLCLSHSNPPMSCFCSMKLQ